MDIHKPGPIRNWRDFFKEFATIVLGVSVALAAEQGVEWLHWQSQVAQAREVIATEMAYNAAGVVIRIRAQPCIESRLDELARIIDAAGKSGSLPPVGDIGLPPRTGWLHGAWESVVASQTATHFPRRQLADISHAYKSIEMLEQTYNLEVADWRDLYAMVGPGRRLDPASEAALRAALSGARSSSRSLASLGAVTLGRIRNLNLVLSADDLAGIAAARNAPLTGAKPGFIATNSTSTICGPIGAVPATYGQGQFGYLPALQADMVKAIPDFSASGR